LAAGDMMGRSFAFLSIESKHYINLIYSLRHWFGLLEAGYPTYPQQFSVLLAFSLMFFVWFTFKKKVPFPENSIFSQRKIPVFLQIALLIFAVFFSGLIISAHLFSADVFTGFTSWVSGGPLNPLVSSTILILLFLSVLTVWLLFSVKQGCLKGQPPEHGEGLDMCLGKTFSLFVVIYFSLIVVSVYFVSGGLNFYLRIMAPMHMAGVMVVLFIFQKNMALKTPAFFRFFNRVVVSAALFLLMASYFSYTKGWALVAYDRGLGYLAREMRLSVMDRFVRELPSSARIFSNEPTILYFLTGRETGPIQSLDPEKISPNTYLVSFSKLKIETNYLNLDMDKMEKELSLELLAEDEQGWVYFVNPPRD